MGLTRDVFTQIKAELIEVYRRFITAIWLIRSYLYLLWWTRTTASGRQVIAASATTVLVLASLLFLAEVLATFYGSQILPTHLPDWAKVVISVMAAWMVWHRLKEFKHQDRESVFAVNVANIVGEIAALDFLGDEASRMRQLNDFIEKVLLAFRNIFRKNSDVRISVMLPAKNQKLKTVYFKPDDATFEMDLELESGEGAAGKAYKSESLIYIPSIKYLHGIAIRRGAEYSFSLESLVYRPIRMQKFMALVCVPIVTSTGVTGVLNVDAPKTNAFGLMDFDFGYVAASVIGMALDKYRNTSNMMDGGSVQVTS